MMLRSNRSCPILPLSEEADCLRLLLKHYPEAAKIRDGQHSTLFSYARSLGIGPYVQHLFLRAAPVINPPELHWLNFQQRIMAMFLGFKAITGDNKPTIWKRFRIEKDDLFRYIVSVV